VANEIPTSFGVPSKKKRATCGLELIYPCLSVTESKSSQAQNGSNPPKLGINEQDEKMLPERQILLERSGFNRFSLVVQVIYLVLPSGYD